MDEYIERNAAIGAFENGEADVIEDYGDGADFGFGLKNIKSTINAIPAADVVPVVHGRWTCGEPCPICGESRFKNLDADVWADWEPPYCPNCGAKMDGGEVHD